MRLLGSLGRWPRQSQQKAIITLTLRCFISIGHIKVCIQRIFAPEKHADKLATAYIKVEDMEGILDSLLKKAMLYKHKDDDDMVDEMEQLYSKTVQEAEKREFRPNV